MNKPKIWIIDTSILTNILNIPGFNQQKVDVVAQFELIINDGGLMYLPFVSILETGNHIGQLPDSGLRRKFSEILVKTIADTINGSAPWKKLDFPDHNDILN